MNYIIIGIFIITILYIYFEKRKKSNDNIPGPKSLPIVGNLLELKGEFHLLFDKWYKEYGPVFKIKMGNVDTVVLTEYPIIKEAFIDNYSVFYSRYQRISRKMLLNLENLVNANGERHKVLKGLVLSELTNLKIKKLETHIVEETKRLFNVLDKYAESGEQFIINNYIRMLSMNVVLRFLFGISFPYNHLEDGIGIINVIEEWFQITGAPVIVDFLPFLWWLPDKNMIKMKQLFSVIYKHMLDQIEVFKKEKEYNSNGADQQKENSTNTILDKLLNEFECGNITEMEMVGTMIDMLSGGTDTTAITLIFTIFELINSQEFQNQLYINIKDSVQDDSEVLSYSNYKSNIPILSNVIKESFRLHSPGPFGLPHVATKDCTVNGYNISKGSMVLLNIYSTHTSDKYWDNSHQYLPSRFENSSLDTSLVHFGLGRKCVGSSLADSEIFTVLASLFKRYQFINPIPASPLNVIGTLGLTLNAPNNYIKIKYR